MTNRQNQHIITLSKIRNPRGFKTERMNTAMKKKELIEVMHTAMGGKATKAGCENAFNALFQTIKDETKAGNSVSIPNFGSFSATDRAEKEWKNPQTGEILTIKARKIPKFKPSLTYKKHLMD